MIHNIVDGFAYGGDYNPEQWPEDIWAEDMRLMKEAGVNLVSIGIFSWALLQPDENQFDFSWLDRVMDLLAANGIKADLATATAAQPNWMSLKHPEIMMVDAKGVRATWGSRQAYCPNSPDYREAASKLVGLMAERYAAHPALAMWHINNEYACHVDHCFCDICASKFRTWLADRYGCLDELNAKWGTAFWSQNYSSWDQVMPPRKTTTFGNPAHLLDYDRFMSDSILALYTMERDILRGITPGKKSTTNFMPLFKDMDYWKWSREMDVISWDSYPDPLDPSSPSTNAFDHDLMRSFGGGDPFMLMEQSPGRVNWRETNGMKHPGLMRYHSFQALAHGADAVMFFQWRQARRGAEQFHSAMITHAGEEARTYREVKALGAELKALAPVAGSRIPARTGIFFDYDAWWASEYGTSPTSGGSYPEDALLWYAALRDRNIPVDMVSMDCNPDDYDLLILPRLFIITQILADRLEPWVAGGGRLLVGGASAWMDETTAIWPGGAPGPLRELLGVHVPDVDVLHPGMRFTVDVGAGRILHGRDWREEITPEDSRIIATYSEGQMKGWPAATVRSHEKGEAFYVSFRPEREALDYILSAVLDEAGVTAVASTPAGVHATRRVNEEGRSWLFLMHEGEGRVDVPLPGTGYRNAVTGDEAGTAVTLDSWGVAVLEEPTE